MGSSHWYEMKSCQAFQYLKIYKNLFRNAKPKQSVKIRHKNNHRKHYIPFYPMTIIMEERGYEKDGPLFLFCKPWMYKDHNTHILDQVVINHKNDEFYPVFQ